MHEGEFLVTPVHIFPGYKKLLGERGVGLCAGSAYVILVRVYARRL